MTTLRIGSPPRRRLSRTRALVLIAAAAVPVVTGATLLVAQLAQSFSPFTGADTGELPPAWIGVAGLAALLATSRRRAPRPRTAGATQRAHYAASSAGQRSADRSITPRLPGA